jgi:hypothetical protein
MVILGNQPAAGSSQPLRRGRVNIPFGLSEPKNLRSFASNRSTVPWCAIAILPSRHSSVMCPPYSQLHDGWPPFFAASIHSIQGLDGRGMFFEGRTRSRSSSSGSNQTCFCSPGFLLYTGPWTRTPLLPKKTPPPVGRGSIFFPAGRRRRRIVPPPTPARAAAPASALRRVIRCEAFKFTAYGSATRCMIRNGCCILRC